MPKSAPLIAPNGMATEHHFAQANAVVSEERGLNQNALTTTLAPKGITFISLALVKSLPSCSFPPINKGFRMVQLDPSHQPYLFRKRLPFGWDLLYEIHKHAINERVYGKFNLPNR